MIADLKPYSAMKASGVSWLGDVPKHWQVLPNRAVFTEVKERDHPEADMLSVTITKGVIRQQALLEDSSKKDSSNQDKSAYKFVRPRDIAYNKMRAWQGAVGVSEYEGIVSPAYVVQRPREDAVPRYLHHLLRTPGFANEAERWSYGITSDMWSLRPEHFKMIYSCLPPVPEQAAIVRFLDHVDRRIRRYVRAKQKLIKLLEEQKQAIIQRAVTRGLDRDVRLKPSGLEWLGDLPQHWEVVKLGHHFRCLSGSTPPRSMSGFYGGDIPWVKTGELLDSDINGAEEQITEAALKASSLTLLPVDTLLIAMYGQGQTRGRTGLLKIAATTNQASLAILPNRRKVLPEYLQLWFVSQYARLRIISEARNATQPNLNAELVKNSKIILPPLNEQAQILQAVVSAIQTVRTAINRAERKISFLGEYRTRLIADVVTGKLDVREAAARLPDEVEEAEALEEGEVAVETEEDAAELEEAGAEEAN